MIYAISLALLVSPASDQHTSTARMDITATTPMIPCMTRAQRMSTLALAALRTALAQISMDLEVCLVVRTLATILMLGTCVARMDVSCSFPQ